MTVVSLLLLVVNVYGESDDITVLHTFYAEANEKLKKTSDSVYQKYNHTLVELASSGRCIPTVGGKITCRCKTLYR